ncbi:MAG: type I CRISPR-associated protein Cas7 [Nitrososphaerota archaeon]|jgi:CRISPR-associated protein Csh2|uniref:type I CRISPR-associated protein Cas7 n=1 Tax=Candidatus Bathycorpusculum sp. TaxID=2994959 RepID=UPI00282EB592|nr:type I CRISPR-associated protein Cas7 [Candidatus Termiticorpusculum sp.]MDR0461139.1 type I CRISPR-associated protein Cas7 [Nitrososphaerota archaeon]
MNTSQQCDLKNFKKELLFYYESRQNPNGDPGFENQPRLMSDGTIMVTDVRIKRTIRDYAKNKYGVTLFVDFGNAGTAVTADNRAKEILGKDFNVGIKGLACKTFDVPLFGGLVTIRSDKDGSGGSQKLTGPVQFAIGRSINQVQILNPQIVGRFVGKEKKALQSSGEQEQFSTFGKFYAVDYALIKIQGAVNPTNLGEYLEDPVVMENFKKAESKLFSCLWEGTNALITRSKFPQRSIFFLEITYNGSIYNDLPVLVEEDPALKGSVSGLTVSPIKFDKLIAALKARKAIVKNVRLAACKELLKDVQKLEADIKTLDIPVELIKTEEPFGGDK